MKTCETCRYYMASPLQEPCESCYWDAVIGQDPTNWEASTNADRIRAMTDEELAAWLSDMHDAVTCPNGGEIDCNPSCKKCWLDWLKEGVEDE